MIPSIYLVVGDTGDYSDHTQWNVAAYTTPEMAQHHQQLLVEATKLPQRGQGGYWSHRDQVLAKVRAALDPGCCMEDEVTYTVLELRLFRHLDEFLENL